MAYPRHTQYAEPPLPPGVAPQQAAAPAPPGGADATLEFATKLHDPNRWIIKQGVPIFKAHQRTDPATGQLISVDLPKLYRIAANMQKLERQGGVPIRMTLGHTEPGKPETEQPPVGGYYKNARVQQFGPNGEPAIVVDEWLDPQYQSVRKNFPYRSSEYYDDAEQITGVALLTRDPYLDLGVVAYERGDRPTCYTVSARPDRRTNYARAGGRQPVLYHLVLGDDQMFDQNGQPITQWVGQPAPQAPGQAAPTPYAYPRAPRGGRPAGYSTGGRQTNYNPALIARAGASAVGSMLGNAMGGREDNARYGAGAQRRGRPGRYAGEDEMGGAPMGPADSGPPPGGPGGPGGDPLQQLQMLAMAMVETLQQLTGGGPGGPGGPGGAPMGPPPAPPQGPFPGEGGPTPPDEGRDGQYSRYGAGAGRRPQGRSFGRYQTQETPVNYGTPRRPVPYGAAPQGPPMRTLSGRPVGESLEIANLKAQLAQYGRVTQMLAYERDQADTEACVAEVQRLADMGYPVSEYEVGELKAKPRDQRGAYINHIMTHYAKVGTEALPPIAGDPTPAGGADPRLAGPASKEEMEAALKLIAGSSDPTAYSKALEQVRYGRAGLAAPGFAPTPFAAQPGGQPLFPPAGHPHGPADAYPAGFVPQAPYGA